LLITYISLFLSSLITVFDYGVVLIPLPVNDILDFVLSKI